MKGDGECKKYDNGVTHSQSKIPLLQTGFEAMNSRGSTTVSTPLSNSPLEEKTESDRKIEICRLNDTLPEIPSLARTIHGLCKSSNSEYPLLFTSEQLISLFLVYTKTTIHLHVGG